MTAALSNEDRLPNDRAVWRAGRPPEGTPGSQPVSIDYGNGSIICTLVCQADWEAAKRWRWGWAPSA